jgi:hypothetical protein
MVRDDRFHLYTRAKQDSEEKEYQCVIRGTAISARSIKSVSLVSRCEPGLIFDGLDRFPETALSPTLE